MPFKTRITDARHNAETGCFEAHVTLMEGTDSFTYSVEVPAPIDQDTNEVQAALVTQARRIHRPGDCTLTKRRVAMALPDRQEDIAKRILFSRPNFLEQMLTRH
ncbi:hypothetical protein [Marinovum sp.]|uniref:hypothetical protein n=1 Tax=Marinovum sp. TaxID=2024839 RepID=UPI002B2718CF|nr:hypothetical protein [Marinovum sp.]